MPLYWLCYRRNNQISVVIQPGPSVIHARMRAAIAGLGRALINVQIAAGCPAASDGGSPARVTGGAGYPRPGLIFSPNSCRQRTVSVRAVYRRPLGLELRPSDLATRNGPEPSFGLPTVRGCPKDNT
jgi:hypothetical protein